MIREDAIELLQHWSKVCRMLDGEVIPRTDERRAEGQLMKIEQIVRTILWIARLRFKPRNEIR